MIQRDSASTRHDSAIRPLVGCLFLLAATAVARVEQWFLAPRDSEAIGVVEGAPHWWRGKRPLRFFNRQTIMGRAQHSAGNRYLLTVPAYSMKGRFVSIEFSPDGEAWSAPQPYRIEHEYHAPDEAKAVYARLTFKDAGGTKPQTPIKIELKRQQKGQQQWL